MTFQIVCIFRKRCSAKRLSSPLALQKRSQRDEGKNASARIYGSSGLGLESKPFYSLRTRSAKRRNDTSQYHVSLNPMTVIILGDAQGRHHLCCSLLVRYWFATSMSEWFANGSAVDCIDRIEQSKKAGRPMTLTLRPNFDLLAQLKSLSILFLDDNGKGHRPLFVH
jgi:hypothetical protein